MQICTILDELNIDYELHGNGEFTALGLAGAFVDAKVCTFISSAKYIKDISDNVVLVLTNYETSKDIQGNYCIVDNPRNIFFKLHNHLSLKEDYVLPKKKTVIGKNCKISKLSSIAEFGVEIGNNVIIEEFVSIKENSIICDNCIIRAGSIIGGEGYEFKKEPDGSVFLVNHVGSVRLESNVEIQQNTCVDKAIYPWDVTSIGAYSKLDNFVHVAHGVKIGKGTMVVAQSGIGGRTVIGDNCWIGFGAKIRNGLTIENNARVNMGAVVTQNIGSNVAVTGNFAIEHSKFIKHIKSL